MKTGDKVNKQVPLGGIIQSSTPLVKRNTTIYILKRLPQGRDGCMNFKKRLLVGITPVVGHCTESVMIRANDSAQGTIDPSSTMDAPVEGH